MKGQTQLIIYFIAFLLFGAYLAYEYYSHQREYSNYEISGTIENFYYDSKGFPTVKIKGKEYSFVYGWDRSIKLQIGDSIHKKSGTRRLELSMKKVI